jgi:hypothetical protein
MWYKLQNGELINLDKMINIYIDKNTKQSICFSYLRHLSYEKYTETYGSPSKCEEEYEKIVKKLCYDNYYPVK